MLLSDWDSRQSFETRTLSFILLRRDQDSKVQDQDCQPQDSVQDQGFGVSESTPKSRIVLRHLKINTQVQGAPSMVTVSLLFLQTVCCREVVDKDLTVSPRLAFLTQARLVPRSKFLGIFWEERARCPCCHAANSVRALKDEEED